MFQINSTRNWMRMKELTYFDLIPTVDMGMAFFYDTIPNEWSTIVDRSLNINIFYDCLYVSMWVCVWTEKAIVRRITAQSLFLFFYDLL